MITSTRIFLLSLCLCASVVYPFFGLVLLLLFCLAVLLSLLKCAGMAPEPPSPSPIENRKSKFENPFPPTRPEAAPHERLESRAPLVRYDKNSDDPNSSSPHAGRGTTPRPATLSRGGMIQLLP